MFFKVNTIKKIRNTDTNVGAIRFSINVELMSKSFKSVGAVDTSRSTKPYRILCEVYAKLIAQLIEYHARTLLISFHKSKTAFLRTLRNIKQDLLHSDCGEHRAGKWTTYKLLKEAENL